VSVTLHISFCDPLTLRVPRAGGSPSVLLFFLFLPVFLAQSFFSVPFLLRSVEPVLANVPTRQEWSYLSLQRELQFFRPFDHYEASLFSFPASKFDAPPFRPRPFNILLGGLFCTYHGAATCFPTGSLLHLQYKGSAVPLSALHHYVIEHDVGPAAWLEQFSPGMFPGL